MFRHLFKRPGLFEEVRRVGDEDQFLFASEQIVCRLVHLNHRFIARPPTINKVGAVTDGR